LESWPPARRAYPLYEQEAGSERILECWDNGLPPPER
jgi:hypothetical protein